MKRIGLFALSAAILFAFVNTATAQVATYFGDSTYPPPNFTRDLNAANIARTVFLSQFASSGTDGFEAYPFSTFSNPVPPPALYSVSGVPVTYTSNMSFIGNDPSGPAPFSVSPNQYASGNFVLDGNGNIIGIGLTNNYTFSTLINGFGIYFINVADGFPNSFTITLQNGPGGTPRPYPINASGNLNDPPDVFSGRQFDSAFFFGIKDTLPFDRVTITGVAPTSGFDGMVFDDLTIGVAIPEPSTYALIGGLSLAGFGGYLYKRRKEMQKQGQRFRLAR